MTKEQIIILKVSFNSYIEEKIKYYIQTAVFFTISHFTTSKLQWSVLLK